jgi:hypothetical protein
MAMELELRENGGDTDIFSNKNLCKNEACLRYMFSSGMFPALRTGFVWFYIAMSSESLITR